MDRATEIVEAYAEEIVEESSPVAAIQGEPASDIDSELAFPSLSPEALERISEAEFGKRWLENGGSRQLRKKQGRTKSIMKIFC